MEIREEQDRRVGLNPEKLLTLEEAARQLGVPADDVEAMIQEKRLPVFRLGGQLLRVRWRDIEGILRVPSARPVSQAADPATATFWERVRDFFYFNDFYLVALLILLTLLAIILTL